MSIAKDLYSKDASLRSAWQWRYGQSDVNWCIFPKNLRRPAIREMCNVLMFSVLWNAYVAGTPLRQGYWRRVVRCNVLAFNTLLYSVCRRSPQKSCLLKIRGGNQERRSDGNLGEDLGQRSVMEVWEGWLVVLAVLMFGMGFAKSWGKVSFSC